MQKSKIAKYIQDKQIEIFKRSLARYPSPGTAEKLEVLGVEKLFNQLKGKLEIKHPLCPVSIAFDEAIGPRLAYLFSIADYEQSDILLLQRHLKRDEKVLELGAGIGLTACLSALISRRRVSVVDADRRLGKHLNKQAQLNKIKIKFIYGYVSGKLTKVQNVTFYLHPEIWFSSLSKGAKGAKKVMVPLLRLNQLLKKQKPDFLMVDIEGAEVGLFDQVLSHYPKKIMIEIHSPTIGAKKAEAVKAALKAQGYRLKDQLLWTYLFERTRQR